MTYAINLFIMVVYQKSIFTFSKQPQQAIMVTLLLAVR